MAEPILLPAVKEYLRVRHTDEDDKITAMIPRARRWVEDHTSYILEQRQVTERRADFGSFLRLNYRPVISVDAINYTDEDGATVAFADFASTTGYPVLVYPLDAWPTLGTNGEIIITYTAGFAAATDIDARLIGAMLALIEGEYSEGFTYPERSIEAAENCCAYLQAMVA